MAKSMSTSPSAPTSSLVALPPTVSDSSTTTLAIPVPVAIPLSKSPASTTKTASKHQLPTPKHLLSKAKRHLPFIKPPPHFRLFNDLPKELQLQIWEHTIEGKVHELHPCARIYSGRMTFKSNASSTPAIFHACHQSRLVALKHYRLMEYTPSNTSGEEGAGTGNGKGILRFYFSPAHDTLLLNSLMGLFIMFMLLEDSNPHGPPPPSILSTGGPTAGVMKGWQRVAIDAERAQLITLLSGINGNAPQPGFRKLLPDLKELVVAFDHTRSGKTRFRTSVWPGEDGTSLVDLEGDRGWVGTDGEGIVYGDCLEPLKVFLKRDYGRGTVEEIEEGDDAEVAEGNVITPVATAAAIIDERDIGSIHEDANIPAISIAKVKRKRYVRGDLRYAFRWSCSLVRIRPRGIFRRL